MRKQTTQALKRLVNQFDAQVLLHMRERPELPQKERTRARLKLNADLFDWWDRMGKNTDEIMFPNWADRESVLTVVSPYPDAHESRHRMGPGQDGARSLYERVRWCGLSEQQVTWTYMVGTMHDAREGLPPMPADYALWSVWLPRILEAADTRHVILHGSPAIHAWRVDLKPGEFAGHTGIMGHRWYVTPVPHGDAALRRGGVNRKDWDRWVGGAVGRAIEGVGLQALDGHCIRCGEGLFAYDQDGIAWCEKHFERNWDKGRKRQLAVNTEANKAQEAKLL